MRLSGALTKHEVVNLALREYAERRSRSRTEARRKYFQLARACDAEGFRRLRAAEKDAL